LSPNSYGITIASFKETKRMWDTNTILNNKNNKNNNKNNKNNKKETNKRYSKEGDALSSKFFAPHDANIPSFSIAKTSPKLARRSARTGHHYEKREQQ
jgi:hypothetical protein